MYESRENVCNVVKKLNSKGTVVNLYRHCSKCLQGDSLSSYVSLSLLNTHAPFEANDLFQANARPTTSSSSSSLSRKLANKFLSQASLPPTTLGGPLGEGGALCHGRVKHGLSCRTSSTLQHQEAARATVTCSYIVGWHRWALSLGQALRHDDDDARPLL